MDSWATQTELIELAPRRHTILIVDDEPSNIRALGEILKADYRILVAPTGLEALRTVEATIPDLVLLDIMMPVMDGFTVYRHLKEKPEFNHVPIIFVTSSADIENETKALADGAVDFISKPLSPPVVRARVKVHLALKDRNDELVRLVSVDSLTGIANRRAFDNALAMEWQRAWRVRAPLVIAMIDIDHFKLYNDCYGHQAGDECLRMVAVALKDQASRGSDVVARYGGEEFSAILPGCSTDNMAELAERMRASISDLAIPHAASPTSGVATISIGMACLALSCDGTAYPQAAEAARAGASRLVNSADQALYQAKKMGRNCAVCVTEPMADFR
ncbi:MAG: diguanylate cyclase [Alphaproteobacteria bacterium]|nr:diguanylate cyclase [Alphaproteobacteria bacterium]